MWPFLSRTLFPPPTEAWLQRASSDPEAQGWGAWSPAEKTHLDPGAGGEEEETGEAEEDNEEDAGFLLSLLEREGLAECPVPDQELEAIKLKLWAMEQAQGPEPPRVQNLDEREEAAGALLARQLLSPETGRSRQARLTAVLGRGVDYGGTAQELEAYFNHCGEIHRVTILCDKFSGHPKGSVWGLGEGTSRKGPVLPKRTNLPGISSTDRGGLRGHPGARVGSFPYSGLQGGARFRPRGRSRWAGPWEGGAEGWYTWHRPSPGET
uniref:PABPN1 like, cytoplasmic n=1 Tax=Bos indicus x Bos taurus TaxID=30522 RepID=A0A4W2FJ84_BOBOX